MLAVLPLQFLPRKRQQTRAITRREWRQASPLSKSRRKSISTKVGSSSLRLFMTGKYYWPKLYEVSLKEVQRPGDIDSMRQEVQRAYIRPR